MTDVTEQLGAERFVAERAEPAGAEPGDPGSRGRLVVSSRAVEHLARHAAADVDGVVVPRTGIAGRRYPQVEVQLAGHRARVQISIATVWPAVLAEVAAGVRDHVGEQLDALAGVRADSVDVRITRVVRPEEHVSRRVL